MKRSLTILSFSALGVLLAGCLGDSGGSSGGGSPAPEPAPTPAPAFQSQWLGTAPFCAAQQSDCSSLGAGWSYSQSSPSGDGVGSVCVSGTKVQCIRQIN